MNALRTRPLIAEPWWAWPEETLSVEAMRALHASTSMPMAIPVCPFCLERTRLDQEYRLRDHFSARERCRGSKLPPAGASVLFEAIRDGHTVPWLERRLRSLSQEAQSPRAAKNALEFGSPVLCYPLIDPLIEARIAQHIQLYTLAEAIPVDQKALGKYEIFDASPRVQTFISWAAVLGKSLTIVTNQDTTIVQSDEHAFQRLLARTDALGLDDDFTPDRLTGEAPGRRGGWRREMSRPENMRLSTLHEWATATCCLLELV